MIFITRMYGLKRCTGTLQASANQEGQERHQHTDTGRCAMGQVRGPHRAVGSAVHGGRPYCLRLQLRYAPLLRRHLYMTLGDCVVQRNFTRRTPSEDQQSGRSACQLCSKVASHVTEVSVDTGNNLNLSTVISQCPCSVVPTT